MRIARILALLLAACCGHAAAETIVWDNAAGNGVWDVGKTANWNTGGSTPEATVFLQNDHVEFRGDGAGEIVLTPAGEEKNIKVSSVLVYGSGDYTFSATEGFGSLTVKGSLNKGGSGTLVKVSDGVLMLAESNSVDHITLKQGTLVAMNREIFSDSGNDLKLEGGTLDLRGFSCASTVELASGSTASILNGTLAYLVTGSGGFTKEGDGTLTIGYYDGFHTYNSYHGDTVVNGGTLRAAADYAFGYGDIILNAGTLDLADHRANNTMQARGDSTLLSNGGRLNSVLVDTHALTVEGKLETGSLNMQNGGDLKLLKGGSISLGRKSDDEEPVWEGQASLAVHGEAEQATLHNLKVEGYRLFTGESAGTSRIDDLDFTTGQDICFSYLTIGSDNSFTTNGENGTITLLNDVTIDLSDTTYQRLKDVYYFDLTGMFHCELQLGDVYLDASALEFGLQDAGVVLDFGDDVHITHDDSVRLGMKGYDTELKLAAGGKLEFHGHGTDAGARHGHAGPACPCRPQLAETPRVSLSAPRVLSPIKNPRTGKARGFLKTSLPGLIGRSCPPGSGCGSARCGRAP